jgi:DNA-binding NarL/FixJ family response regulator
MENQTGRGFPDETTGGKINILVAEDYPLFRKGLKDSITATGLVDRIYEAGNGKEAIDIVQQKKVDLIFMDFIMPEVDGYHASKIILSHYPKIKIIALTEYDEIPVVLNFFAIGAVGFLTKAIDKGEIKTAILNIMKGNYNYKSKFDEDISLWLSGGLASRLPFIDFSHRDLQLMIQLSKGKTSVEIARHLKLRYKSVETFRHRLLNKTKVKNSAELVDYIYRNGIMDPSRMRKSA